MKNKHKIIVLASIVITVIISARIVAEPYRLSGDCMEPAIINEQLYFLNRISPYLRHYQIGDIIVFKHEGKDWVSRGLSHWEITRYRLRKGVWPWIGSLFRILEFRGIGQIGSVEPMPPINLFGFRQIMFSSFPTIFLHSMMIAVFSDRYQIHLFWERYGRNE